MALISIDENKCKKDGICVNECPMVIISQPDPKSVPVAASNAEKMCLTCGHCVAVCPHGALSLKDMGVDECPPIRKEFAVNREQVEQLLRSRRSVRHFKDKAAPEELIEKLVDMAHYAPTAHNEQEVCWTVINGKDEVKKIAGIVIDGMRAMIKNDPETAKKMSLNLLVGAWDFGMDVVCRDAHHLILVYTEDANSPFAESHVTDCATALAYMELAAPSLGLGTFWNGMFLAAIKMWEPLRTALGFSGKVRCHGVLTAGYPKFKYYRMPSRTKANIRWGI